MWAGTLLLRPFLWFFVDLRDGNRESKGGQSAGPCILSLSKGPTQTAELI